MAEIADVIVHLDEDLGQEDRERLEDAVREDPWVVSASFSRRSGHLMTVVFDSGHASAGGMLNHFRERGLHAQLVGL